MFGPDYAAGCPACSAIADGFNGFVIHLANHDVTLSAISRAPLAKLQAYKRRMGWTFPWSSSFGSDFNADFNVSFTEEQQKEGLEYNYRRETASQSRPAEEPAAEIPSRSEPDAPHYLRCHVRNRRGHVHAGKTGYERVRTRRRRCLPRLFHLCAGAGWPLGHVSVARPRPERAQRDGDGRLMASSGRVRRAATLTPGVRRQTLGDGNEDRRFNSSGDWSKPRPRKSAGRGGFEERRETGLCRRAPILCPRRYACHATDTGRDQLGKVDALDILINNAEMPEARTTITATGIKKDSSSTSNVYSYRCERSRFSKSSSYYIKSATCVVAIRAGPAV
jgi:uncharacterized protein DUF899